MMPLTWAPLLLLSGFQLLAIPVQSDQKVKDKDDEQVKALYLPAAVEFALHSFNLQSQDRYAYRLVHILSSSRTQLQHIEFSMKLQLGRTICRKYQEDLDNCPFQDSGDPNNTLFCVFIVRTQAWETQFTLLHKDCSSS